MSVVTIKKLALELNISAATVSRALKDSHEISTETKQKVLDLAKKLNYEPNHFASNLRKQKSKTIAVIIPEVANHFFSKAINGIENIASQKDYHVLIYQTHENTKTEIAYTQRLLSGRVDGILISLSSDTDNNQHFSDLILTIPTVFFDRTYDDIDAVEITTDDYESAYNATCHLLKCGCKKIAYLSGLHNLSTGKKRVAGYQDALRDHSIAYNEQLIIDCGKDSESDYKLIKNLLLNQKPDGVLSSIEELVIPCYNACNKLSINIPKDLKIISYSNLDTAPLLNPSLSTITQPAFEIGQEAANSLFKILEKKEVGPNESKVLKSSLIIRNSTGY